MPHSERPQQKVVDAILSELRKEYIVVGKTRVRAWYAWLIIGVVAGVLTGIVFVASRSGQVIPSEAATPLQQVEYNIKYAESFKNIMVTRATREKVEIQPALAVFSQLIADARTAASQGDFVKAQSLIQQAKASVDYPTANNAIRAADAFYKVTLQRAKAQKYTILPFALDTHARIFSDAKTAYAAADYPKAKRSADDAKISIDYYAASYGIRITDNFYKSILLRAKAQKFTIPPFALTAYTTIFTEAQAAYTAGDYPKANRAALEAKASIDYPGAQYIIRQAQYALDAFKRKLPIGVVIAQDATMSEAQSAFGAGDYQKAVQVAKDLMTAIKIGITVETPTFTPSGGTFAEPVTVTLDTETPGADIRYTTNGALPIKTSPLYTGPLTITDDTILKAKAFFGAFESTVGSVQFTITPIVDSTGPVISSVAASSITASSALITWNTDEPATHQVEYGATVSYGSATLENTDLMTSHAQPVAGLSPDTLYHYRIKSKDAAGNLATSNDFTLRTQKTDVGGDITFTPGGGNFAFTRSLTVALETDIPDATIYYTLDAVTPTQQSIRYTRPLTLTYNRLTPFGDKAQAFLIKARAYGSGEKVSDVESAVYVLIPDSAGTIIDAKWYGEKKVALILVNFPDVPPPSKTSVEQMFFTDPIKSFDAITRTIALDHLWLKHAKTFGWYTASVRAADLSGCESVKRAAGEATQGRISTDGYERRDYDMSIIFIPRLPLNVGCGGMEGIVPAAPASIGYFVGDVIESVNPWAGWPHGWHDASGLSHSGAIFCEACSNPRLIDSRITRNDAGDPFDILGGIWSAVNFQSMEKEWLEYLSPERIKEVTTDGTYTIHTLSTPAMPPDGYLALKIRVPSFDVVQGLPSEHGQPVGIPQSFYYFDYRQPVGGDIKLIDYPSFTRGVNLHILLGGRPLIVDLDKRLPGIDALADGQSFYDDLNNVTLTQLSHTPVAATVKVKFGPVPCQKVKPYSTADPAGREGTGGVTLTYDIRVSNMDFRSCAGSTFAFSVNPLPGFTTSFTLDRATAASGGDAVTKLSITPALGTPPGNYIFTVRAVDVVDQSHGASVQVGYYIKNVADATPPELHIDVPIENPSGTATFYGDGTSFGAFIKAVATDNDKIVKVELYIDDILQNVAMSPVYDDNQQVIAHGIHYSWDTTGATNGLHTIKVRAYDRVNLMTEKNIAVKVDNSNLNKPDLVYGNLMNIKDVAFVKTAGVPATVSFRIINAGSSTATERARVRFYPERDQVPTFATPSRVPDAFTVPLAPGEEDYHEFTFTPPGEEGSFNGYIVIDSSDPGTVDEIADSIVDNTFPVKYQTRFPDYYVLYVLGAPGKVGKEAEMDVTIQNRLSGIGTVKALRVRFHPDVNPETPPGFSTPSPVPDLIYSEEKYTPIKFRYVPASPGNKLYCIVLDDGDPGSVREHGPSGDSIDSNRFCRPYTVQS